MVRFGKLVLPLTVLAASMPLALLVSLAQDGPKNSLVTPKEANSPLSDPRISVHTLLREDIFAGFMAGDLKRFERGEKNIESLLKSRPEETANILAWKGGAVLYRAVRSHESKNEVEFIKKYQMAKELFAEAGKIKTGNGGVNAITGGSYSYMADRLPKGKQVEAWERAYTSYTALYKSQSSVINNLPVHHRGEVLGGMAMTAHRTGHAEESALFLAKILRSLPDTNYSTEAQKWKMNPELAGKSKMNCMSCHDAGRLSKRIEELNKK